MRKKNNESGSEFPGGAFIVCLIIIFIILVFGLSDSTGAEKNVQNLESAMHQLEQSLFFIHSEGGKRAGTRHPELKEFNIKKIEKVWKSLPIDDKRKLVELCIIKSEKKITNMVAFLLSEEKRYPFRGLGIRFSATPFNAVHMASVIMVENILRGSPAVGKLQPTDLILAVNEERFDDFDFEKFTRRMAKEKVDIKKVPVLLKKEIEEKYTSRFFETIKNSEGSIKLEILRNHDRDDEKKLTVEVEAVNIGEDFPKKIGNLSKKYFFKMRQNTVLLKELSVNSETAPEKDLKEMFEQAFLVGFHERAEVIKKYNEIVYVK